MLKRSLLAHAVLAIGLAAAHGASAEPQSAYQTVMSVPLGGPDRWDYVTYDPPSHRVFVAHGDKVSVVDGRTGARLGEIVGVAGGSHGVAVSPKAGRGYTDDGEAGVALAFDPVSLKITGRVDAAPDADGMVLDPFSGHVFVMNGDSGSFSVIDPVTNTLVATVKVGGKLEAATVDGQGSLFINGAGEKIIIRVDTRTNAVTARWPIPECESPHGIAIDRARHRLFSSCVNQKLVVIDTDGGKVAASLPIGKGTDSAGYDPIHRRVFSSNGRDGTVTVIQQEDADHYRVLENLPTGVSGRTMDLDPETGRLFVALADLDPAPVAPGARPKIKPGSLRLLILDPKP